MKNSLFKRAIAAASAVPVALTQCLSVANAVSVDYTAPVAAKSADTSFTLDKGEATSLLYIAPKEDYARVGDTFTKSSNWNGRISTALTQISGKEGVLDLNDAFTTAIEKSGKYSEVTKNLIDKLSPVSYKVTDEGKVIINGSLDNITPMYTEGGANTIGGALREIGLKYGVEDLVEPGHFFSNIVIGCDYEAVVDGSNLADSTVANASLVLTDTATGNIYKGEGAIDWAIENFELLKDRAKEVCEDYSESINMDEAIKKIDDSVTFYIDKLEAVKAKYLEAKECNETIEAATAKELVLKLNDKAVEKTSKNPLLFAYKNEAKARELYKNALDQVNAIADPYSFNIEVDECIDFANNVYDIVATYSDCVATFDAKFVDKEADAVEAYIESAYNVEVLDVYKTVSVIADINNISNDLGGFAIADMKFERVVVVEDKDVTTTTTTTTKPGGTTTTTTEPGGTTTTTEPGGTTTTTTEPGGTTTTTTEPGGTTTTTTGPDGTTTTTTGPDGTTTTTTAPDGTTTTTTGPDGTTTTTTTTTGPDGTTSTTTEPDGTTTTTTEPDGTTTTTTGPDGTTTTTTGPDGTTTTTTGPDGTTTTTTDDSNPFETTTTVVMEKRINYHTEIVPSYYLNTDEAFDIKAVKSIGYTIEDHEVTYGENGVAISDVKVGESYIQDILSSVEFKDVPADVDKIVNGEDGNQFAGQVQLYASKDIVTQDGFTVAKAGDKIVDMDGKPVTATVYIGVKGDANLDMVCDAVDASIVLAWYAKGQTGQITDETTFAPASNLLVKDNPELDNLAAFLADVDNEGDENNHIFTKTERSLNSTDASKILVYYSKVQTGAEPGKATWSDIVFVK